MDEVKAQKFSLVDDKGVTRASLHLQAQGPHLTFFDLQGKNRAEFGIDSTGDSRLTLCGAAGKTIVEVGADSGGAS